MLVPNGRPERISKLKTTDLHDTRIFQPTGRPIGRILRVRHKRVVGARARFYFF